MPVPVRHEARAPRATSSQAACGELAVVRRAGEPGRPMDAAPGLRHRGTAPCREARMRSAMSDQLRHVVGVPLAARTLHERGRARPERGSTRCRLATSRRARRQTSSIAGPLVGDAGRRGTCRRATSSRGRSSACQPMNSAVRLGLERRRQARSYAGVRVVRPDAHSSSHSEMRCDQVRQPPLAVEASRRRRSGAATSRRRGARRRGRCGSGARPASLSSCGRR